VVRLKFLSTFIVVLALLLGGVLTAGLVVWLFFLWWVIGVFAGIVWFAFWPTAVAYILTEW